MRPARLDLPAFCFCGGLQHFVKKDGRYTCEPFEFAIASLDEVFVFHLGIVNLQDTFAKGLFKRELSGFGTQYANGLTQEGLVSFTFIDPNKRTDDPVTADGDSGETGTDKELGYGSGTPNNKCFSGKEGDQRSLLLNKGESLEVKGRICGLQRISWRELFF